MPITDLLTQGLQLMLLGMSIVFAFLVLLVVGLYAMSWLAQRIDGRNTTQAQADDLSPAAPNNDEIVAVVGAAVHRYRANQQ